MEGHFYTATGRAACSALGIMITGSLSQKLLPWPVPLRHSKDWISMLLRLVAGESSLACVANNCCLQICMKLRLHDQ